MTSLHADAHHLAALIEQHKPDMAMRLRELASTDDEIGLMAAVYGAKAWSEAAHPRAGTGSSTGGQFIRAGSSGGAAETAKRKLGGKLTEASIRAFQRAHGLQVDGTIGRQTAAAILGDTSAKTIPPGPMTAKQRAALEKLNKTELERRLRKKPAKRSSGGAAIAPAHAKPKPAAQKKPSSGGAGLGP